MNFAVFEPIKPRTTAAIMCWVMLAAIPGILVHSYWFGFGIFFNLLLCIAFCCGFEWCVGHLRRWPKEHRLRDNSAALTGLLLAISLPPLAPWWIAFIGCLFAILVAKHCYGGLGFNIFNPAMVGYVVLLISFPVSMTSWLPPTELIDSISLLDSASLVFLETDTAGNTLAQIRMSIDATSMATPLDSLRTGFLDSRTFSEQISSAALTRAVDAWQTINLAFLIGGLLLLALNVIRWHIPIAVLGGLVLTGWLINLFLADQVTATSLHLFTGATMFGAFFIATDPVSASTTTKGRVIYGFAIGMLTIVIRTFGSYPDGFAFAVLLLNICVPLIDQYTQPITYGHQRQKER